MTNKHALERLFAIKKRPKDSPVSALFASMLAAQEYLIVSDAAKHLADAYLPGPLTIILPVRQGAPSIYSRLDSSTVISIGLRISSHPTAMALATAFGGPISTTSANIHGQSEAYCVSDILMQLQGGKAPDIILDDGQLPKTPPSTIVAFDNDSLRIVRQGSIQIP